MHPYYRDILENIPMEPAWWDENAVPRYCAFSPDRIVNFGAGEAVLLLIACQHGDVHHFRVALSRSSWSQSDLANEIRSKTIHYGDPPRVNYCDDGASNSVAIKVLEYWRRLGPGAAWERDPSLEIDVLNRGFEERAYPSDRRRDLSLEAEVLRGEPVHRRHSKRSRHGRQLKG